MKTKSPFIPNTIREVLRLNRFQNTFRNQARLLALLTTFLVYFCNLQASSAIYGSGSFILNDGPVYSAGGTVIGSSNSYSGAITLSGGSRTVDLAGGVYSGGLVITSGGYLSFAGTINFGSQLGSPPQPHVINVSAINGTASKSPDNPTYDSSTVVTLSAVPDAGYIFEKWTESTLGTVNIMSFRTPTISFTTGRDLNLVAHFVLPSRIISLQGANLTWNQLTVGESASRTFTITNQGNTPLNVYNIIYPAGFRGDWSGQIAAHASQSVNVTFIPPSAGTFSGNITVNSDATEGINTLPISAVAANIYKLTGSSAFSGVSYAFNSFNSNTSKNSHISIKPVLSIDNSYATTTLVTVSTERTYWEGSIVNIQASPVGGYVFENWTENGKNIGKSPQFDIAIHRNYTLVANYVPATRFIEIRGPVAFGSRKIHSTTSSALSIVNSGNAPIYISGLRIVGQLGERRSAFNGAWSGWIPAASSQRVVITFQPNGKKKYLSNISVIAPNQVMEQEAVQVSGLGM